MNPSLSQTSPFPAGIGFIVEVIASDGAVVEIPEAELEGDADVAFVPIVGETVVDVTAVGVVEVGDVVLELGLRLEEMPACGLVVSGSSVVKLGVVVRLGLASVDGLPPLVD